MIYLKRRTEFLHLDSFYDICNLSMQTMIRKSVELFKPCDKQMNLQDEGHKLKTLSQNGNIASLSSFDIYIARYFNRHLTDCI